MDGIDCALVSFAASQPQLIAAHCHPLTPALRSALFALTTTPQIGLQQLGELHIALGKAFAAGLQTLLAEAGVSPSCVSAIGSHGQTVYHQPAGEHRFSIQLGDANTIAALTGIPTVADFRGMDIALGGQGAPLAPLFHQAFLHSSSQTRAVLNVGGISNLTLLPANAGSALTGFDTGPGNVLMDYWIGLQRQQRFDAEGQWAAQGKCHAGLLASMREDNYFRLPAPKSTGREHFNGQWLQRHLQAFEGLPSADVQATLLELTASSICDALQAQLHDCSQLIVCGGGAHNQQLLRRLKQRLPSCEITISDQHGLAADWVEALTFAWLARQHLKREAVDCRQLTGASRPAVLGALYPA